MRKASTNHIEVPCGFPIWLGGLSRRCEWTVWLPIWSWERADWWSMVLLRVRKQEKFVFKKQISDFFLNKNLVQLCCDYVMTMSTLCWNFKKKKLFICRTDHGHACSHVWGVSASEKCSTPTRGPFCRVRVS